MQVDRLLDDEGVFIIISHGNPEQRLPFLEQFDIEEPNFTPWVIEVQAVCKSISLLLLCLILKINDDDNVTTIVKPKEYPDEELDSSDPNSMYFVYICRKTPELVLRKKVKLGRLTKKQLKAMKPREKRVNLKPSG